MIQIIPAYTKSGNEWCTCCSKAEKTKRIKFSQDGNGGTSIVLCDDCRRELMDILSINTANCGAEMENTE